MQPTVYRLKSEAQRHRGTEAEEAEEAEATNMTDICSVLVSDVQSRQYLHRRESTTVTLVCDCTPHYLLLTERTPEELICLVIHHIKSSLLLACTTELRQH